MAFGYGAHKLQHLNTAPASAVKHPSLVSFQNHAGFSDDTLAFLAPHVLFQYMGDVDYERGTICETLRRMQGQASEMVTAQTTLTVKLPDYGIYEDLRKAYPDGKTVDAFVIAKKENLDDVLGLIAKLGEDQTEYSMGIRDTTGAWAMVYKDVLNTNDERREGNDTVGWLDIHNDFMFFIDEKMYGFFAKELFDLKP